MMSTGTSLSTGLWDLRHPSSSICLTCRLGYTTGPSYFFLQLVLGPLNSLVWYVPSVRYTRGLGWRMHCGAEVTESSTNKQHHLSLHKPCGMDSHGLQKREQCNIIRRACFHACKWSCPVHVNTVAYGPLNDVYWYLMMSTGT